MILLQRQPFLYSFIFSLFCFDVWSFFIFEQQILHLLFSFLIAHACYTRSIAPLATGIFFLGIESFIMYGMFGLSLLYTLPIIIFILTVHSYFYITLLYPVLASSIGILVSILLCQGYLLGLPILDPYTIITIFVNLLVTITFSLKSKMGKTRQSLIHEMG